MNGFTSPNHTQTPNDLFDVHMLDMSEAELKVTLAIIRKTLGYHKKSDPISLTQLQKLTGLSRQAVSDGTTAAINRGIVEVVGTGKRGVIIYGLVINSDQSTEVTDLPVDQSKILYSTGLQNRHTKETTPKEKKKETALTSAGKPKRQRKPKPYDDVDSKEIAARIDGWLKALPAKPIGNYFNNDTMRTVAAEMVRRGISADCVTEYVSFLLRDKFWKDKTPDFTYVAKNIPAWINKRSPAPSRIIQLEPEHTDYPDTSDYVNLAGGA